MPGEAVMEFRILGPVEALVSGSPVSLGGPKQRAVLAMLLLNANQVVASDTLIDELWGEQAPETVRAVLQGYVSSLRKTLGPDAILTRPPGYMVQVEAEALDLERFERLSREAREAVEHGEHKTASALLREALALWRGRALADLVYEPFAQAPVIRLEELRLNALEDRIDADLALGDHRELVGELEALVQHHPLRERLRGQLMLALYRCGRQAEALEAYQRTRRALVDELGIDPTPPIQELERAILRQDPALDLAQSRATPTPPIERAEESTGVARSILVVADREQSAEALLGLAEPLARRSPREIILMALVSTDSELAAAAALVQGRRAVLRSRSTPARAAAFTSAEHGRDIVRLASQQNVDLVLLDATDELLARDGLSDDLAEVLTSAPCDVAVLAAGEERRGELAPDRVLFVPFGGSEHEWAAAELGAWLSSATGAPLRLVGTAASADRRDASRLLATASLVIQQVAGVEGEPLLVAPGQDAMIAAADDAGLVLLGLSERWRQEGVGAERLAFARRARAAVLLVRGGLRPGGLAPSESYTRYTWTLASR
jgi:DNA-binding SARP family transcriptional activator